MKNKKLLIQGLIAAIIVIFCDVCAKTCRDDDRKELKIAIAWRADTDKRNQGDRNFYTRFYVPEKCV